jgi:hypothetical protein
LNLNAKVIVATLETQRARFLRGDGPKLLVVDEYQMIGDAVRGVHYELALALAPPETQLLLLSGSVGNPQDIVAWLQRIGRDAILISHQERPVPLEEVDLRNLSDSAFVQSKGFWPRMIGRALRADLAPVLMFAPRRNASEEMATSIASAMAIRDPLQLSPAQEALAGQEAREIVAQSRRVSSQRTQLCSARGIDRAARESGPAQRRRRDDGSRRPASTSRCVRFSSPARVTRQAISSAKSKQTSCCRCSAARVAAASMTPAMFSSFPIFRARRRAAAPAEAAPRRSIGRAS